jgi:hypothetical protein
MKRRDLLINAGLAGAALSLVPGSRLWGATSPDYDGPLFVMVEANGGWDVTSFCDPKMNVPGERVINHWAENDETRMAGNIPYAPFAGNERFFEKYHRHMLVINGIDAQTNAHSAGVLHNWSGRLSIGYPSMPALLAAIYAPDMPISWINNGGYPETANLVRFTRLEDPRLIKSVLRPTQNPWDGSSWIRDDDWAAMRGAQQARLDDLRRENDLLPWQKNHRDIYYQARQNAGGLEAFAELIPSEDQLEPDEINGQHAPMRRQAQLALLAFKAGVAMTADLTHFQFDTHDDHDNLQASALGIVTDAVDYLWETAELLGLADRLTVMIASDFSRTPHYNDDGGKDHWPIGSAIFMQKNAPWGNRVVGLTDEGHNALPINPATLQVDEANGTIIYPRHVLTAFRALAGIDMDPVTRRFQFFDNVEFDFFNPALG